MMEPPKDQKQVPQFKSFKAKATAEKQSEQPIKVEESKRSRRSLLEKPEEYRKAGRKEQSKEHGKEQRKHHAKRRRLPPDQEDETIHRHISARNVASSSHVPNADLFTVDRKGDPDLLRYGSINRTGHRHFSRSKSALGLSVHSSKWSAWDLDQPTSKGLSGRRITIPLRPLMLKPIDANANPFDHNQNYVSIEQSTHEETSADDESDEPNRIIKLPISRTERTREPAEADPDQEAEYSFERTLLEEQARLTALTKAEPQDVSHWLNLANFQQRLIPQQAVSGEAQRRTIHELKLGIYEAALKRLHQNEAISQLKLHQLQDAENVWDVELVEKSWIKAIDDSEALSSTISLWIAYINFLQRNSAFDFETCKLGYIKYLIFLQIRLRGETTNVVRDEIFRGQAYIFLRLTCFLRDAGYHEMSIALWQAIIDLQLPGENRDVLTEDGILTKFQELWDSEVPRVGEKGYSHSWGLTFPDQVNLTPPKSFVRQSMRHGPKFWKLYADQEFENAEDEILKIAGRTEDEVLESDPFHIVLFTDLEPILEALTTSFEAPEYLIAGFLCYSGLPPASCQTMNLTLADWWQDPFVRTSPLDLWNSSSNAESTLPSYLAVRVMTQDSLFREPIQRRTQDPSTSFISNTLQTVIWRLNSAYDGKNLMETVMAEYLVAYQSSNMSAEAADQTAKLLLKGRRANLRLYHAYALLKCSHDDWKAGDMVLSQALTLRSKLPNETTKASIMLLRTRVWKHFAAGLVNEAFRLIFREYSNDIEHDDKIPGPASTGVLRVRQALSYEADNALQDNDAEIAALYVDLLATFDYFLHEQNIQIGTETYQVFGNVAERDVKTSGTATSGYFRVLLYVYRNDLISYHVANVKVHRPVEIKDLMMESLTAFPTNADFLVSFANHERQYGLNERLRSYFIKTAANADHDMPALWHVAIWQESRRRIEAGGSVHGVRSLFQNAVASPSGQHSVSLWLSFLQFEIAHAKNSKAIQGLVFRGMKEVPWSKWFVLTGMKALASMNLPNENEICKKLYDVLMDLGLRITVVS